MKKATKKVISLASMLVLSFVVVFAAGCSKQGSKGETVDLAGKNADVYSVKSVSKLSDGGYLVNATAKGYNSEKPIELAITFDAAGSKVTKLEVVSQEETQDIGSKITEETFLSQFNGISVPVTVSDLKVENPAAPAEDTAAGGDAATAPSGGYTDGTYTAKAAEASNGYIDVVTVEIKDGKIASVDYNPVTEDGTSNKYDESTTGKYVMTEEGPLWHEQVADVAASIVTNQSTSIALGDDGKTDAIAGVSISLTGMLDLTNQCLAEASGQISAPAYNDGTYTAKAAEASNGYVDVVSVEIKDGKIASVNYNPVTEDGSSNKYDESTTGKYVMTEDGPLWHEQVADVAAAIVANQSTDIKLGDDGKTDAIAGVSISLTGMLELTNDCLGQATAAPQAAAGLVDGTYTAKAAEASNGYVDVVTITVAGGKITEVNYNPVTEDGTSNKYDESTTGKYVMTEEGPLWHEQVADVAAAIVTNQSTDIKLGDDGKTDAIAGVSISLTGMLDLTNQCIAQATAPSADAPADVPAEEPKDEGIQGTAFDAVSGATVSSKAVARAINNSYFFLQDQILK